MRDPGQGPDAEEIARPRPLCRLVDRGLGPAEKGSDAANSPREFGSCTRTRPCGRTDPAAGSWEPTTAKYRQRIMFTKWVIALLLVLLQACGPTGVVPETRNRRAGRGQELNEATAVVLESGRHGPMLCLGTILESLPPQCGDVRIAN